jgi:hypothetical protein
MQLPVSDCVFVKPQELCFCLHCRSHGCLFFANFEFLTTSHGFPLTTLRAGYRNSVIAIDEPNTRMIFMNDKSIIRESLPNSGFDLIATCSQTVVISNRDGQIFAFDSHSFPSWHFVASITSDYCCALAVNGPFATIAIGKRDNHIVLSSLFDGVIRWAHEVGGPPQRIAIIDGWGFVLVEAADALSLFNINGKLMRSVALNFKVSTIENMVRSRALAIVTVGGDVIVLPRGLPEF